MDSSSHISEKL